MLEETVTTMTHYTLSITPFTPLQLRTLETLLTSLRRRCLGLPSYQPTYTLLLPPEEGGLGPK